MISLLRDRIDHRRKELGLTRKSLSLSAGLGRTYISDLYRRPEIVPTVDKIDAIARALGTSAAYLMGDNQGASIPPSRNLPIIGKAAASAVGAENLINEAIEYTATPPGLAGVKDAYCLWIEGDSMHPLYRPRDPIFVHPRQPLSKGDIVVIQQEIDGSVFASVKEFVTRTAKEIVTIQYNPPKQVTFKLETVYACHRVLPLREVLNL